MIVNYWLILERYLESNGVVGGLIPGYEIFSLFLMKNYLGGHVPHVRINKWLQAFM